MLALGAAAGISACGGSDGGTSLDLVAYSTPQKAYEDGIEPAFAKTPDGKDVEFSNSFGSSGDQSRAVEGGQSADVV
ncbi:MAG: sulfate ABC transporter substrate-binding protein, partial [Solirubrobacterales bacterium]